MFFKDAISVEVLNGVPFPSGYVFKDNPSEEEIVITGQKTIDTICMYIYIKFRFKKMSLEQAPLQCIFYKI